MRRINILLLGVLFSLFSTAVSAATIAVNVGDDIAAICQAASAGDIIELQTVGTYTWNQNSSSTGILTVGDLTIQAKAGLASRPTITFTQTSVTSSYWIKYAPTSGGTLTVTGIDWDANNAGYSKYNNAVFLIGSATSQVVKLIVDNCQFRRLMPSSGGVFDYQGISQASGSSLTVTNSTFLIANANVWFDKYASYAAHPTTMSFANCLFSGASGSATFNSRGDAGLRPDNFTLNHCTFTGGSQDLNLGASAKAVTITNCLFVNSSNASSYSGTNLTQGYNGIYPTVSQVPFLTATYTDNPALDGNGYATTTHTGNDGKNIGYYNTAAPSSVVTVSASSKTGFTYVSGSGPSSEQSFTVGGTNLTANISLTAPTDYEISTGTGGSFAATSPITLTQSGGTVATTTIYVRLKAGLSAASYNSENIAVASSGVSTQNVVCSGSVTPAPSVTLSTSSKTGFTYASGAGPSAEQSFTVSGANLTSNISLTPPTDYEISTGTGGSFAATSPITLTQSGGTVTTTTIYVRLKAGLSVASYNTENVVVASTGVTTQNVACSGSVTSTPTPVVNISTATLSGFSYLSGSGPSSEQSFTVSGTNLTANISVTAPTDYETSTGTGGSFSATSPVSLTQSGGTVATTTIYVRLKAGLSVASYNSENIAVASTGVTTQNVVCSGNVNDVPSTAVTPTTRSGFTYSVGVGPSATQTITVSGGNLQGNITLAPPTDYEISLSSGSGFMANPSTLTLTPSSGSVASTTVYIRLKSGLAVGDYNNEDIITTSSNATTKNVTCSGTVTAHNPLIQIASGDVGAAVASAISGDIIELTTSGGAYSWATAVSLNSSMTITIRAAAGLAARPVITNTFGGTPITFNDHCVFTLSGVEIHNAAANYFINVSGYTDATWTYTNNFYIDNCKISGLGAYGLLKTVYNHPTLSITNSEFSSNANSVLKWTSYVGKPSTLTVSNCLFKGNTGSNAVIVWDAANPPSTPTFSHCTFQNNTAKDLDLNVAKVPVITNCLFVGSSQASVVGTDLNVSNVGVYPAGNTSYFSTSGASTLISDPSLDANGYPTASVYIGTGSDERNIGYYDQTILMTHNTGSANWGTASSWLDNAVPVTGSKVLVKNNLTIDQDASLASVTVNPGSKLTVNSGKNFTSTSLTLNSDPSLGTATFVDNGTSTITTATVNQYLSAGRNWYIASPVTTANASVVTSANGNVLYKYDESSNNWVTESGSFNTGAGYVATVGASNAGNYTFTGTLNNGNVSDITLTRHAGVTKEGFNLVGNPYPSYLNAMTAINNAGSGNIEPTIWYRTKYNSVYYFETVNTTSGVGTNNSGNGAVTAYIPPMQSFWVRVATGKTSATLNFTNAMRSHESGTNRLKAPTAANSNQEILRLQVSNNINSDEAVIYFNSNALDTYDVYDSPKQSNSNVSIPEIYTIAGTEQLVINGLNSIQYNAEIPIGFTSGQSGNLTIKASQFSSFEPGTQLILRDKVLNTEQDLTVADYTFSSEITTNNTSRFSLIFKAPSVTTGINFSKNENVWISTNSNNQILIIGNKNAETLVTVYNALGQLVVAKNLTSNVNVLDTRLVSGVYTITLNSAGKSATTKVIIK
ncbi:MAG: T9SS type A sorting domain-containing protein [Paludibacter sp.]